MRMMTQSRVDVGDESGADRTAGSSMDTSSLASS